MPGQSAWLPPQGFGRVGCTKYATHARATPRRDSTLGRARMGAEPILAQVIQPAVSDGFLSVGQPTAERMARRAVERRRTGRTLLVHGPSGSGKERFVDDLLALSFCTAPARRPCNAC